MKKTAVLLILIAIIVSLSVMRTVISNSISTSGVELGKIQDEGKKYQAENILLKEKVYELSSLMHISKVASKLGFTESKSSFVISSARPIALKQ